MPDYTMHAIPGVNRTRFSAAHHPTSSRKLPYFSSSALLLPPTHAVLSSISTHASVLDSAPVADLVEPV
jgi:hypothetical protein